MNKMALVAALAAGLIGSAIVDAKGVTNPIRAGVVAQTNISGTPLTINIGDDNSFQVFNSTIGGGSVGQIYPTGQGLADMGWFVLAGGALTAPSFGDHGGTATASIGANTPFGARTISAVSGAGTAASPFTVTVQGTAAGMSATQTITYVNGDNFFRKAFTLNNPGSTPVTARVFLASDIYLANSDAGTPFREPNSGSPGGQTCPGVSPLYTILHIAQGPPATGFTADGYNAVWTQIGAGALNNTVNPGECIDNGAGLQWDVTVPAGGSTTVQAATSFGDIPAIVGPPQRAVSAPSLGFPGLAALALALMALAGVALHRKS